MKRLTAILLFALACPHVLAEVPQVENPGLIESVRSFLGQRTPESRIRMYRDLNQAVYLVPLQPTGDNRFTTMQIDLPKVGRCMPVFSDNSQVTAAGLAGAQLLDTLAYDLWTMFDDLQLDCVLLNPATDPLPLRQVLIEQIRRQN